MAELKDKKIDFDTVIMCYMRWSTKSQLEGDSGRRQATETEEWCDKNGYKFNKNNVIQDSGKSGYYAENFSNKSALGKFISAVSKNEYKKGTILIIEDYSRFSRDNVIEALEKFLLLLKGGIELVFVRDGLRYTYESVNSNDLLTTICHMSAAHEESARKSHHLKKYWNGVRAKAVKKAKKINKEFKKTQKLPTRYPVLFPSNAPNWLKKIKIDGKKYFEEIPERSEIIKYIFQLADVGIDNRGLGTASIINRLDRESIKRHTKKEEDKGLGTSAIANILIQEGVEPFKGDKKNTSKEFNESYILRLLKDRRLLGEFQPCINPYDKEQEKRVRIPNGKPLKHYFPQIISETTLKNVEAKIAGRKKYSGGQSSKIFTNLFTKIIKCAFCGNSMTIVTKKGSIAEGGRSTYLQCSMRSSKENVIKCDNKSVRYFDTLEKSIIHSLVEIDLSQLFDVSDKQDGFERSQLMNEIQTTISSISSVENKLDNATDAHLEDRTDQSFIRLRIKYINELNELEVLLESQNQELANQVVSVDSTKFFNNLKTVTESLDRENRDETCEIRKAINMLLADTIQYIAIDGNADGGLKYAWVVFDLNIIKSKIMKASEDGNEWLNKKISEDKEIHFVNTTSHEESDAMGFFPAHIKIRLDRFKDIEPTQDQLFAMRESFQVAPKELVEINKKLNGAINRGWKHLRRKEYKVLDNISYNAIFEEAMPLMDDELIAELEQQYNDNVNSKEQIK